jgi:hypothetical protein
MITADLARAVHSQHDIQVSERGRIPASIIERYEAIARER